MLRFSDYSFKDKSFTLETINAFKTEMINHLAIAIDDILYGDGEEDQMSPTNSKIICFLFGIREKAAEIEEIMIKLDGELKEMGFYKMRDEQQQEATKATA